MKEFIDLVDKQNNIIGVTDTETAHDKKQLHRVVGIFLFDAKGNVCLQNGNKYNKYDLSVGGHVQRGEIYDKAAQREMAEELNVDVSLTHLSTFLPENTKMAHFWALYYGELPTEWVFLPTKEVASVIFMSMEEVSEKFRISPELFTHGFANAFIEFNRVRNLID